MKADARTEMEYLVGCLPDQDLDVLGGRYLYERLRHDELLWRPWLTSHIRIDGLDLLSRAQADGRGVTLSLLHHGQYGGVFPSLARYGVPLHIAIGEWLSSQTRASYYGMRWRQHRVTVESGGAHTFPAPGSYPRMLELLKRGEVVAIASDLHGGTQVTWLGRRVSVASGAARLALETGAVVIPITAHRGRPVQRLQIEEPLVASDNETVPDLLARIFRAHEPAVRAWPESVEFPLRRVRPVTASDVARFGFESFGKRFAA